MNYITYTGSIPSQNIPSTLYGVLASDQLSTTLSSTISELYKKQITRTPIESASVYWNTSSIQFASTAMQSTVDGLVSSQDTLVIPLRVTGYVDSLHPSSYLLGSNTLASTCSVGSKIQVQKSPGMPTLSSLYFHLRLNVQ